MKFNQVYQLQLHLGRKALDICDLGVGGRWKEGEEGFIGREERGGGGGIGGKQHPFPSFPLEDHTPRKGRAKKE